MFHTSSSRRFGCSKRMLAMTLRKLIGWRILMRSCCKACLIWTTTASFNSTKFLLNSSPCMMDGYLPCVMIKPKSSANLIMSSPKLAKVTVFLNVIFLNVSTRSRLVSIPLEMFGCSCVILAMIATEAAESSRIWRPSRRFEENILVKEEPALVLNGWKLRNKCVRD